MTTVTRQPDDGGSGLPPPCPDIDAALNTITTSRATHGAAMSRFEFAIGNLQISGEPEAARRPHRGRRLRAETANMSRAPQILQQAGTAMVAQANQLPQNVLSLLR